jgi:hypothetical protein
LIALRLIIARNRHECPPASKVVPCIDKLISDEDVSSLRDWFRLTPHPALKRWAKLFRRSAAEFDSRDAF